MGADAAVIGTGAAGVKGHAASAARHFAGGGGAARRAPASARRRQRGQALLLLLPLLALLVLALLWVFDSGQVVSEKQRLVNATDAAALSAATWQARTLNFESYMTRAVIANEAAIAQSVSLRSWSAYMERLLPGTALLTRWLPILNVATLALERFWTAFNQALQPGLTGLEGLLGVVDHDLAAAQRLMDAVALEAVPEVVRGTLAANDARFRLSEGGELLLLRWSADWVRFSSLYGGAFRWRQADVLARSLDGFTTNRRNTFRPPLVGGLLRFEKRGGTELLDFETWRGVDTLSMHTAGNLLGGGVRERLPLAWAGAENGQFNRRPASHGGSLRVNPRATRLALATTLPQRTWRGLPSLRDLSTTQRRDFNPPHLVVRSQLSADALPLAGRALGVARLPDPRGRQQETGAAITGDGLFAESAAEVRFTRVAPRRDLARELPSLYSPYWHARLVAAERASSVFAAAADRVPAAWLEVLP